MGGSRVFDAQWDGSCAECGMDFYEGDEVRYDDDGNLVAMTCCNGNMEPGSEFEDLL